MVNYSEELITIPIQTNRDRLPLKIYTSGIIIIYTVQFNRDISMLKAGSCVNCAPLNTSQTVNMVQVFPSSPQLELCKAQ